MSENLDSGRGLIPPVYQSSSLGLNWVCKPEVSCWAPALLLEDGVRCVLGEGTRVTAASETPLGVSNELPWLATFTHVTQLGAKGVNEAHPMTRRGEEYGSLYLPPPGCAHEPLSFTDFALCPVDIINQGQSTTMCESSWEIVTPELALGPSRHKALDVGMERIFISG